MKKHAPATARNSEPIAEVLAQELPEKGTVLEIASGTGEHAVFFARRFRSIRWQPTDPDVEALASIKAWAGESGLSNLLPPMKLDASHQDWPTKRPDAVVCINMVHISPWCATEGLFANSSRILAPEAPLILYGPYLESDVETAPSNLAFDQSLKDRNPDWGLRETESMDRLAERTGFTRSARHEMPANNLVLVYRKQ